jgi:hypothetical protein
LDRRVTGRLADIEIEGFTLGRASHDVGRLSVEINADAASHSRDRRRNGCRRHDHLLPRLGAAQADRQASEVTVADFLAGT